MIDLNSVIAMMNKSASITQAEADSPIPKINYGTPTELQPIQTPKDGKKKFDKATEPIQVTSNMLPVDPQAQVMTLMGMDVKQQNYAMQVLDIINSGNA